jgi:hypothetical protein
MKSISAKAHQELPVLVKLKENASAREDFEALLLTGPTFSKKQLDSIAKTRRAINRWRSK